MRERRAHPRNTEASRGEGCDQSSLQNWPVLAALITAVGWVLLLVRLPVFLVMYWLRPVVLLLCNLVSVPTLFAWLFAWYAFPDKTAMVWGLAVINLCAFATAWIYDLALAAIAPDGLWMTR